MNIRALYKIKTSTWRRDGDTRRTVTDSTINQHYLDRNQTPFYDEITSSRPISQISKDFVQRTIEWLQVYWWSSAQNDGTSHSLGYASLSNHRHTLCKQAAPSYMQGFPIVTMEYDFFLGLIFGHISRIWCLFIKNRTPYELYILVRRYRYIEKETCFSYPSQEKVYVLWIPIKCSCF